MKVTQVSAAIAACAAAVSASKPAHGYTSLNMAKEGIFPSMHKRFAPEDMGTLPPLPNARQVESSSGALPLVDSATLQADILTENLLGHTDNFQAIAYQTTGRNRVFGSPGHNFTALYVYQLLQQLEEYYSVEYQFFDAPYSGGNAQFTVENTERGAGLMTYSPNGRVEAPLVAASNVGCTPADYPSTTRGSIVLISRGSCEFGLKAALAGAAGASGAIIYNNINGSLSGTLGALSRPEGPYPPTASLSQAEGLAVVDLINTGAISGILNVNAINENRTTMNVIAQTRGGDQDNVIMVGAHADSVEAGPGINDNGSGSAGILEIALQLAKYNTTNAVRFGWWSAEEFGLLGSEYYVSTLPSSEIDKIRLYLNFDMIASPNYFYGIYDGDGSAFNISGPPGSAEAEALFEEFFRARNLPSQGTEFNGRSDYGPFLEAGVAAGGLFTGAEGIKTPEEAIRYGGTAGTAYDENYHEVGDTTANLNSEAFIVNSQAIANSVATYALSFDSLPTRRRRIRRRSLASITKKKTGCYHKSHERVAL